MIPNPEIIDNLRPDEGAACCTVALNAELRMFEVEDNGVLSIQELRYLGSGLCYWFNNEALNPTASFGDSHVLLEPHKPQAPESYATFVP